MKQGTFQVLLAYLDGAEEYRAPSAAEELAPDHIRTLGAAAARRRRGRSFALVVRRNWRLEASSRGVFPDDRLPTELRELWAMAEGDAVDRLIGYQDGERWVPGLAAAVGLTPAESKALRWMKLEFRPMADVCRWLGVQPRTVYNSVWKARQKLLQLFRGVPMAAAG